MKINILISTIDQGIDKIKNILLPYRDDVKYIVSHQYTDTSFKIIPDALDRQDVVVSQISGKGLSISRNNAIKQADGDICVISDDDVSYTNEYIDRVKRTYLKEHNVDIACFKIETNKGEPEYKKYATGKKCFSLSNKASVSSIEITFKLNKIKSNKINFDSRFGIGSEKLIGGEETVFLFDCLKSKLKVCYYPYFVVNHPFESTVKSLSKYDKRRVSVTGAFDARINGYIAIPKAFLGMIKIYPDLIKQKKNPLVYLKERIFAAVYILKTNLK